MLNAEVDTLLEVSVTNNLLHNNTNGGLGDVVDNTGLTVVELVGHTLLDRTVGLDVNDVTDLVDLQVGGKGNGTMLLEVTRESVTSTRSVTAAVLNLLEQVHDSNGHDRSMREMMNC